MQINAPINVTTVDWQPSPLILSSKFVAHQLTFTVDSLPLCEQMEVRSSTADAQKVTDQSTAGKMSALDTVGIALKELPCESINLNQSTSDSPAMGSDKEEVVSMLGESREASEEFRDSSISTLTANSRSTSLSSLTISSNDFHKAINPIPTKNGRFLAHQNSIILPKNSPKNSAKVTHSQSASSLITGSPHTPPLATISKTLSFRTDSTGSLGSLLSNVDIPVGTPSRVDPEESESLRDSFDTDTGLPRRFNNHNISSILISALKQSKRPSKKSVSFSIPSDDDIARRARKSPGSLLYHTPVDVFDDSMPDYQVVSPKSASNGGPKARLFASPTKTDKNDEKKDKVSKKAGRNSSPVTAPSKPTSPNTATAAAKTSPNNTQLPPRPPVSPMNVNTNTGSGAANGANHSPKNAAVPVFQTALGAVGNVGDAVSALPLMQRVGQASTTAELCEVFDITTDTVFLGETMKKRFSKDLLGKDRLVWIVPKTKSIHWAKNARDKRESFKVKYFLLDKNSPFVKAADKDISGSSASSGGASSVCNSANSSAEVIPVPLPAATGTANAAASPSASLVDKAPPSPLQQPRGTSFSADRASGELVGIIHSATIHHLSIRIQTESGEYLNLTLGGGTNAAQRAKDWFAVIKALTKDIGVAPTM